MISQVRSLEPSFTNSTRLSGLISLDAHAKNGHYTIRSLYFDDYDDRCLLENENGTAPREKFRIRIYNGSAERISLECKRKERGMTHKTSCPLTREQTELLMAGQILPNVADQPPLLQKLTAQMLTRRLRPVVIVEYERIPFVYRNGNVRITVLDRAALRWTPIWFPPAMSVSFCVSGYPTGRSCRWDSSFWKSNMTPTCRTSCTRVFNCPT